MSEQAVSQIAEQLNQEKWTRLALTNYTAQSFKDLDLLIAAAYEEEAQDEVLELCEEHLKQSKNSPISLYISGIINLKKQTINDANLLILINMFTENGRWIIAKYLAEKINEFGENKHAYRTLADCWAHEGNEDEKYKVWEKLIRVDYEEADIVRALAERAEAAGQVDAAVNYFKKALHRYINRKSFNNVREIWKKLIELCPEETEFFYHAEGKVSKIMGDDRAVMLLEDLYPWYKEHQHWDTAIEILKRVVHYDPKSPTARNEIVACYRAKYAHHSQLEEYIRLSNLSASWRSIHDAIADFEKHISFDSGNYVFHRTWGVGLIKSVKDDFITIDFPKNKDHKMSLKLAVNALTILGKDHFWVHRITMKPAALKQKILKDHVWALKTIIKSFDNQADMKRIKAELADSKLLDPNEWASWSSRARACLKEDPAFSNLPDKPDVYVVRDQPINYEEKIFNRFKAEKDFFNRLKTLQELMEFVRKDGDESIIDSERFRDMLEYFAGYVRNMSQVNEITVSSMLIVNRAVKAHPFINPGVALNFVEVFEAVGDEIEALFIRIANAELRKDFLDLVKEYSPQWPQLYIRLLPLQLSQAHLADLIKAGYVAEVQAMFTGSLDSYRDNRDVFAWFVKNCQEEEWFRALEIPKEKILISMIHLYDISLREIDNKKDLSENRKLNKQVSTYLFKDGALVDYLKTASVDSIARLYNLLTDAKHIDPEAYKVVRSTIKTRFPDFKFAGDQEKDREIETVSRSGFFTIYRSYEEKQKALQNLQEVEVPKNSKEIAVAREYGDLKENAEYKAAKERQEILNSTAARWRTELEQARAVKENEVDTARVGFGTEITLLNHETKKKETYTIMGPWESNPDDRVISYLSPFGAEMYRHGVGDELRFVINEREYHYTIQKIEKADLGKIRTTTQLTV